jgi:hypothetical protein
VSRPLLAVSVAFFALGAVSFAISYTNEIGLVAWLRDVVPYLFVAFAPIFALDAQASFGRKGLVAPLVIAGTTATLLFAVHARPPPRSAYSPFHRYPQHQGSQKNAREYG